MQLLLFGFATAILVMDKTPQHLKLPKKKGTVSSIITLVVKFSSFHIFLIFCELKSSSLKWFLCFRLDYNMQSYRALIFLISHTFQCQWCSCLSWKIKCNKRLIMLNTVPNITIFTTFQWHQFIREQWTYDLENRDKIQPFTTPLQIS